MDRSKILVSIPHAGTEIPEEIRSCIPLSDHVLRNESDLYTDQIFSIADASIVTTKYSRIISDPNRAPDETYTEGVLRALGVVMLNLPSGVQTFTTDPTIDDISGWIDRFHKPYHDKLQKSLVNAQFIFDCHSMWSQSAAGHFGGNTERADVILGNQYFCSCSAETTNFFAEYFTNKGYTVAVNDPYPGRYILGTYCSRIGLPGIQIEFNRALYLDEQTLEPRNKDIQKLHLEFDDLVTSFCHWFEGPQDIAETDPVDMSEHIEFI